NVDDADNVIGNEYNTGSGITNGTLEITDGGGTESVNLISTNADNDLAFGTDGALYLNVASVTISETITTLADNGDGSFTYTNENGAPVSFQASTITDNGNGTSTIGLADGGTITVDNDGVDNVDDADNDPTNENQTVSAGTGISVNQVGQNFEVTNTAPDQTVSIADGGNGNVTVGGTYPNFTIDVPDATVDTDDQDLSSAVVTANESVEIQITDGNNTTIDIRDADSDATNEYNTAFGISGSNLRLTDGGGNLDVPLSSLGTDEQDLSSAVVTANESVEIQITNGNNTTIDIRDADSDPTNENQTVSAGTGISVNQVGQNFEVTNTAPDQTVSIADGGNGNVTVGGTYPNFTIDVPDATVDTDDQDLSSAVVTANESVEIQITDGNNTTIDIRDADSDATNEIQDLQFTGGVISLTDDPGATTIDLSNYDTNASDDFDGQWSSLTGVPAGFADNVDNVDDADNDATNEYNTAFGISGSNLRLTDGGGNLDVPLSSLGTDEQDLSSAVVTANESVEIQITNGNNTTIDIRDADSSTTNEINTAFNVASGNLNITDSNGTLSVPLSSIDTDDQTLTLTGNTLAISEGNSVNLSGFANTDNQNLSNTVITPNESVRVNISGGTNTTIDIRDADSDATNEYNTAFGISGSNLRLTDGGGNLDVPLSALGTDEQDLSSSVVTANESVEIQITNGNNTTIDIRDADSDPSNEIQVLSRSGTTLLLSNGGGSVSIADNDNNSSNEIQTLTSTDGSVTITPSGINYNLSVPAVEETVVTAGTDISVTGDGSAATPYVISNTRPNIFYPPSIAVDVATTGTGRTIDLHAEYLAQYGTPSVASAGAPAAIPTYANNELYYYVTYYDTTVFANVSVNALGIMSYDVISTPTDYNTLINVVFVAQ
ncbi:hypothetical protein SAMN04488009_3643, partial [Maribacter sedimenticola]